MPLSIKDAETDELARRLAAQMGESLTQAVKESLRQRLAREQDKRGRSDLRDRLLEIGRCCAARMEKRASSSDHADLLYDDRGLPR
jgi:antitoxin VapB